MSTPTQEHLRELERRRTDLKACAESLLIERKREGVTELSGPDEIRFRSMMADVQALDETITEYRSDLKRADLGKYANLGGGGERRASSAGQLAPLGHDDEQLRRAFNQVGRGDTAVMEARATFSSATGLIPPELGPVLPVFPTHEQRLLAKLPGIGISVPSLAYVEVTSTTGTAGVVAEGAPKPEIVIPGVQKVATARKLAAHVGISWEAYSGDYSAFVSACQGELMGKITDVENLQLFAGTGEANGQVNGIATATGVLTLDGALSTGQPGPWDAIEQGIEMLRSGPALAEPDLALCSPATWSAIRRTVDLQGRYYVAADPSTAEVSTAWGIPVLVSTQFTPGKFVLVDTARYGRVVVREPLVTRVGYSGTDFTDNIVRFVSEERITQTIERPQAICVISGMPTVVATKSSKTKD